MTIQFNGTSGISLSGNVIANYFIGNIEANELTANHIAITGNVDVGGNVTVAANVIAPYITGTLTTNAQPNITSVGNLNGLGLSGDIIPTANVMYSLGNATHQWKDLWVSNNTIYLNSVPINLNAGNILQVDGVNVALSSNTYVNSGNVTTTANVNGANIVAAANVNSANVTASNSVVSPSVVGGMLSMSGNTITGAGPELYIDPNGAGGIDGNVIIQGNLLVKGTTTTINSNVVDVDFLTLTLAANSTSPATANGAGIVFGQAGYATLLYNSASNGIVSSNDLYAPNVHVSNTIFGNIATFTGNVGAANLNTSGEMSATGNAIAANFNTSGKVVSTGDMSTAGNASVAGNVYSSGNASVAGNVYSSGNVSVSGNIYSGSNISCNGDISSAGNIYGKVQSPEISASGNITAGNVISYGELFASGGVRTFGDVSAGGNTVAIGSITGGSLNTSGALSAGGTVTFGSGTPWGVLYLNSSKQVSTGSSLSSDGTNITAAGAVSAVGAAITSNTQLTSLGVGTAASGTTGEIRATNNVTAFYSSDARFKTNTQNIVEALAKAVAIGGKTFDWTDEYIAEHGGEDGYFVRKNDIGVIAQDVQSHLPQAVRTREDGSLAVDYAKLSALALAAIAELSEKLDQVTAELAELKNK